jgi:hypothetical protein
MALTWTEVEARIQRARKALEAGQYEIEQVGHPTAKAAFEVRNGENAGGAPYTVAFYEDHPTGQCTCPDYQGRGGPACKHTAMVVLGQWPQQFERWQQRLRELCAPEQEPESAAPQPDPDLARSVEQAVREAVHDALSTLEEQLVATIAPQVIERVALAILARK